MSEIETMNREVAIELDDSGSPDETRKRKDPDDRFFKVTELREEMKNLVKLFKDVISGNRELLDNTVNSAVSWRAVVAHLMEESDLPLSNLVREIHEKLKCQIGITDVINQAAVKNLVQTIGKRASYGSSSPEADVMEDEDELALWCWEVQTTHLKLFSVRARDSIRFGRRCRRKIHERFDVILAMIKSLEQCEGEPEIRRAEQKLNGVFSEAAIRLLLEEARRNGIYASQSEVSPRKKMDLELQNEKLLKRQQARVAKDQKRQEKEHAELKRKRSLQKSASIMENFVIRGRTGRATTTATWDVVERTSPPPPSRGICWENVPGLDQQQKRQLTWYYRKGVLWKHPKDKNENIVFRLMHGGDVKADGNCLFTAACISMDVKESAHELRMRTVNRFLKDLRTVDDDKMSLAIRNMYSPDVSLGLETREVKLLALKQHRKALDSDIDKLIRDGMRREKAAETVYKGSCVAVNDGQSWVKYMSISGSPDDEYDIISLQYTVEGSLTVDENRDGRAAAFGDDIAIEWLATEFEREIFVVQAHGSDSYVDEDSCGGITNIEHYHCIIHIH